MSDGPGLESLLRAREDAERALERGDDEIEYRGYWIGIEDHERGWDYSLNGHWYGKALEYYFEEIDRRAGSTAEEMVELEDAWEAHLERRDGIPPGEGKVEWWMEGF